MAINNKEPLTGSTQSYKRYTVLTMAHFNRDRFQLGNRKDSFTVPAFDDSVSYPRARIARNAQLHMTGKSECLPCGVWPRSQLVWLQD